MSEKKSFSQQFLPQKTDSTAEIVRKTAVLIIVPALLIAAVVVAFQALNEYRAAQLDKELAEMYESAVITPTAAPETETAPPETETETTTTPPPPLVPLAQFDEFLAQNPDTAGWITVPGTNINNVVVQAADNEYYLDRDFNGNKSQPGTIYADFRGIFNDYNQCDNVVLYGHNQANGAMFGTLKNYKITKQNTSNFSFYKEHPTFKFSTLYEEYEYKIIAMFVIEVNPEQTRDGQIFDYHNYIYFDDNVWKYDTFIENVMARTAVDTGVDVNENDKFVTLSTCSNEFEPSRFVVIGRRVRDGEDPTVDTSAAVLNEDAVEPDWSYIYSR